MTATSLNWQLGVIATLAIILLRRFFRRKYGLDNLPGPVSPSWLTGNFLQLFNPYAWKFHESIAKTYGSAVRIHGPFGANGLYIFDSKAMHTVLVKNQDIFEENDGFLLTNLLLFGDGLLSTLGHRHRKQRKMLTPVFSSAHMRDMIPTFFEVTHKLENGLKSRLQSGGPQIQEVDILSWMGRTALELMGQAGLGYSFDPLIKRRVCSPVQSNYKRASSCPDTHAILEHECFVVSYWICYLGRKLTIFGTWPIICTMWEMKSLRAKKLALEKGDEAVSQQIGRGKDLISILMKENMKASDEDRLEDGEVLAQEIIEAKRQKDGQDLSYDELVALPYLDAVCRETLAFVFPSSDCGPHCTSRCFPRGTVVMVSIFNANKNPDLWGKDADEWKPERWLSPLPDALLEARIPGVYSHLMTFIGGGRSCIGFKFSQLEMKVVISVLVENFKFSPSARDSEILWQMNGVTAPIVGKDNHPQLPIGISLVD
ncbi:cytochrome P450 [Gymnopus androsaceus JB14]|uniref:Cytochrome P450 n=1 Tax=Gymnopus androsaceus JB14 TaxID=1447944 RepID=A0A6A4GI82_9AGAR|nr:cytochrome P450 [Gymnopus androsaceus JB14]